MLPLCQSFSLKFPSVEIVCRDETYSVHCLYHIISYSYEKSSPICCLAHALVTEVQLQVYKNKIFQTQISKVDRYGMNYDKTTINSFDACSNTDARISNTWISRNSSGFLNIFESSCFPQICFRILPMSLKAPHRGCGKMWGSSYLK